MLRSQKLAKSDLMIRFMCATQVWLPNRNAWATQLLAPHTKNGATRLVILDTKIEICQLLLKFEFRMQTSKTQTKSLHDLPILPNQ